MEFLGFLASIYTLLGALWAGGQALAAVLRVHSGWRLVSVKRYRQLIERERALKILVEQMDSTASQTGIKNERLGA